MPSNDATKRQHDEIYRLAKGSALGFVGTTNDLTYEEAYQVLTALQKERDRKTTPEQVPESNRPTIDQNRKLLDLYRLKVNPQAEADAFRHELGMTANGFFTRAQMDTLIQRISKLPTIPGKEAEAKMAEAQALQPWHISARTPTWGVVYVN